MLQKRDGHVYQSLVLAGLPGVIHGFSGRAAGDMRYTKDNRARFLITLGINKSPVFAQQTHSATVPGDGLVSGKNPVAVFTADCVPVLLVDPQNHVCCAVHAGWRGTLGGIVTNAVQAMVMNGACVNKIYTAIGPHIAGCCYDVFEDRVDAFKDKFGKDEKIACKTDGVWYLDLGWVNYRQLIEAGIRQDHIDAPPTCTSCQNSEFFSYRRDSKESYGEMMAVIGFR